MTEPALLRSFRFEVTLLSEDGDALGDGAFQECTGLEVEMDVQELQEGGRNDGVIRRIGRAKFHPIVLKRGMLYADPGGPVDGSMWNWFQDIVSGWQVKRYGGIVRVMSVRDVVAARWTFDRGLPQKIVGPQLNARTGEVAIEELHIAHEGLRMESV